MTAQHKRLWVLSDRTITPFCRELTQLQQSHGAGFEVVDVGYDAWLRELFDPGSQIRQDTAQNTAAALAFVLSPRVLETPELERRIREIFMALDELTPRRTVFFSLLVHDPRTTSPLVTGVTNALLAARVNGALAELAAARPWLHLVDHAALFTLEGCAALHDHRFEASAQMYFSPLGQKKLAAHWQRTLNAAIRTPAKVMIVDLDNTLWGGILGEDGPENLQMGASAKGWPHRRLQQDLLRLKEQGVLLAIASKNNADEALKTLAEHPDCLLRPADFAALQIHWEPKSVSLRRMAEQLNLGLDSFVFLDDSEFERSEVTAALPQVRVLPFPQNVMGLTEILYRETAFDRLAVTEEDRARSASYAAEAQRTQLRANASSPAEFFRSLHLKMRIFHLREPHVARAHQLTNKTNQFNMTTERLSEHDVRARIGDARWLSLGLRVSDQMGDSGFVGVAFVDREHPERWTIANFLLSCRVIGRTVESALLSWIAEEAAQAGAREVMLEFRQSAKNGVARQFLDRSGFTADAGEEQWRLRVPAATEQLPPHYVEVSYSESEV